MSTAWQIGYSERGGERITSRYGGTYAQAVAGALADSSADHVDEAWVRPWREGGGLGPVAARFRRGRRVDDGA